MDNFVTSWHKIDDIVPDGTSDVFFVVNDVVYAGKYDAEVDGFMMADGKGYAAEETNGFWMYIPPLITFALGGVISLNASIDFSAFASCITPINAFNITIAIIITESI